MPANLSASDVLAALNLSPPPARGNSHASAHAAGQSPPDPIPQPSAPAEPIDTTLRPSWGSAGRPSPPESGVGAFADGYIYRTGGTRKLSRRICDYVIEPDGSKTFINGYSDRV